MDILEFSPALLLSSLLGILVITLLIIVKKELGLILIVLFLPFRLAFEAALPTALALLIKEVILTILMGRYLLLFFTNKSPLLKDRKIFYFHCSILVFITYLVVRFFAEPSLVQFIGLGTYVTYIVYYFFFIKEVKEIESIHKYVYLLVGCAFVTAVGAFVELAIVRSVDYRVGSLTGSTLHFSVYLALLIPVMVSLIAHLKGPSFFKNFLVVTTVLCVISLILTIGRGAWVQCFIALFSLVFLIKRWRINAPSLAVIAVCVILLFVPLFYILFSAEVFIDSYYLERLFLIFDWSSEESNLERVSFWEISLDAIAEQPYWGHGLGTWGIAAAKLELVPQSAITESYYLKVAVEAGWVGLFFFVLVLAALFNLACATISLTDSESPFIKGLVIGVTASFIGIYVEMAILESLEAQLVSGVFWTYAAFIMIIYRSLQAKGIETKKLAAGD